MIVRHWYSKGDLAFPGPLLKNYLDHSGRQLEYAASNVLLITPFIAS